MMNVPSFWQLVAKGMLLFIALAFDHLRNKEEKKIIRRKYESIEKLNHHFVILELTYINKLII